MRAATPISCVTSMMAVPNCTLRAFAHHLDLDRGIQRARRFVSEKNLRTQKHRHNDAYTLTHTAGKLKWVTFPKAFRRFKIQRSEKIECTFADFPFCSAFMSGDRFKHLVSHRANGRE